MSKMSKGLFLGKRDLSEHPGIHTDEMITTYQEQRRKEKPESNFKNEVKFPIWNETSSEESSSSSSEGNKSGLSSSSDTNKQVKKINGNQSDLKFSFSQNSPFQETFRIEDTDESLENLAVSRAFASILLHIVDNNNIDFLFNDSYPRKDALLSDQRFRAFICSIIWILAKTPFEILPSETPNQWLLRATKCLQQSGAKRKDQKLRLVFSGILKLLVKRSTSHLEVKVAGKQKLAVFLDKYGGSNREEFKNMIEECKTPSKKRLKTLFDSNELLRLHVMEVLNSNTYLNMYMQSRMRRATKICSLFMMSFLRAPGSLSHHRRALSECQKSVPWAESDLRVACSLLKSITTRPEIDLPASQEMEGLKLEKANFILEAFGQGSIQRKETEEELKKTH